MSKKTSSVLPFQANKKHRSKYSEIKQKKVLKIYYILNFIII